MDELAACAQALAALDARARSATAFAADLRERHREASRAALAAYNELRDRETQFQRMIPLRASYADDVSKWTMLTEADRLFEAGAAVCSSCGAALAAADERCPACRFPVGPIDVGAELRAARTRLAELTRHLEDLEQEIPHLRAAASRAQDAESRAAAEVDAATAHAVTPFLAERDAVARRREEAAATRQRAADGLRLVQSLERRANGIVQMMDQLESDREQLAAAGTQSRRADRSAVIRRVGERYRDILSEFRYPKLADAYLAEDLTPYVRGEPYPAASSGGRTLIALAWQLCQPAVTSAIVGARSAEQLAENVKAIAIELPQEDLQQIDAVSRLPSEYPQWYHDLSLGRRPGEARGLGRNLGK